MTKRKLLISICSLDEFLAFSRKRLKKVTAGREMVEPTHTIYFTDEVALFSALSPRRMELLRFLKKHGPLSRRQLAFRLKRAYANVHEDVRQLLELEVIEIDSDQKLLVPWDELDIALPLANLKAR